MTHLSYDEFTKLMENKGETFIDTKECIYEFTGMGEYKVCVEIAFKLKEEYKIGVTGYYIKFNNIITLTKAQRMYMSLK